MGETIRLLIMNWNAPLLGGPNGIYGIPAPDPVIMGSIVIPLDSRAGYYLIALIALTAVVFLSVLIDRCRVGRIWDAIGMDDMLAGVIGVNVYRHKLASFVISSTIAGLAGVVFAHMMTYISPYDFTFFFAVQVLVYVIFGGAITLVGPIVGVTVLVVMSEILREVGHYELILYGFIVILVLRFFPGGALALIKRVLRYYKETFGFYARRIRGGQSRE
jgi:branched-chain amino acid transport system permease protein